MKTKIGMVSRIVVGLSGIALFAVLFVPLWRIDLVAPQYPEGLFLLIHSNKLSGNVDIINGLNHYIGMKTLHTDDFIEFKVLPFIIGFFSLLFIAVSIVGKKRLLNIAFILFVLFGIIAMIDFWKWEFNYGHNLDPDAAIKVPGMSYQPPLIGFKQLLNFSAYSFPSIGGWIFICSGAAVLGCITLEYFTNRKNKRIRPSSLIILLFVAISISSCSHSAQPIKPGTDNCSFCKMTISDEKYGAEIMTKKGKAYKFDDTHCLLSFLHGQIETKDIAETYFTDFESPHKLLAVKDAYLFQSDELKTPMGGHVAAFSKEESVQQLAKQISGTTISWNQLKGQ
jgi:copper chaperone NosL